MVPIKNILIVGGGIAGLCTAIGLGDTDIEIDIVELNPKWDVYGVGIIQLANALRAMASLGIADRAVAEGYPMEGLQMFAPNGHQIAHIPQPKIAGPNFPAQNGISRPALHGILQDGVKGFGANVHLGMTVQSIEQNGDVVDVTFTDGSQKQYDLVMGTDGLRSVVRQMVFGEELQPNYEGQMVWRYNLPRPDDVQDIQMYLGDPKVGLVPLSDETMYMFITDSATEGISRYPEESLADEMRKRLDVYGDVMAKYKAQITDPAGVVLRPFETILLPKPWHRGRVVLVGDSAHAMTAHIAQGAAMAMEDAVVFTEELKRHDDLETALTAFNNRRFDRVAQLVELSRQLCEWEREHVHDADVMGTIGKATQIAAEPI